jgi:hypothetical protein
VHLGFRGPKFTWNNGRTDHSFTKKRLDRAVANKELCDFFGEAVVQVMADRSSYHNPIFISFNPAGDHRRYKDNTFRCEASWALHADYRKVIKTT